MKKFTLFAVLSAMILVAGCGKDKIDITKTDFDVESCNKYFELMDCILENDENTSYSPEMRDSLREEVKAMQEEWNGLSEEDLDEMCSGELLKFEAIESSLNEIGCSVY